MDWERACLVAIHVGTMERLLSELIVHVRRTKLADRQVVSHRLADLKVRLEAARLLTREAAASLDARHAAGMAPSIAKLFGSEALLQSASDAVGILGECGVIAGSEVERILRDAVASTIYSGTSDIQRNIIAKWLRL
jgi:alkylation response protein AidB-like acyl-CoA dehydrogenase